METIWRLIDSGFCRASYNMALDEAISAFVRKGSSPPVLRFYGWEVPSVSIGCFQRSSDINIEYCTANGIPLVRRPTGGRAILHSDELTYSFSVKTDRGPFSRGLLDSYRQIGAAFRLAFRKAGIPADAKQERERGVLLAGSPLCFESSSFGEILVDNRKAVGSAQKRWDNGMLQQGSVPFSSNEEELRSVFGLGSDIPLKAPVRGLRELAPGIADEEFREIVSRSFEETFSVRLDLCRPSPAEEALARELEEQKYLQPDWTLRR